MDGGAKDSGYAARISAAFRQLEETGAHARNPDRRRSAAPAVSDPEEFTEKNSGIADLPGADDQDHELEIESSDRPDVARRIRLPKLTFGMRRAASVPSMPDSDNQDAADEVVPEADRYSATDAAFEFDDDVIDAVEGDANLEFHGDRGRLVLLVLQNTLLTIATLGAYRFWAQRNIRGYLWQTVSFQEEHPEYQGRALDSILMFSGVFLFVLTLFALLILLPQIFVPFRPVTAALELFFIAGLFLTLQVWCQWRRRYNLDHTAWHGIRFERSPHSLQRLMPLIGVWSLVLLTAGLAYPLARVISARDLFKDVRFGPASVVVDANAQPLLLPWAIVYATLGFTFVAIGTDLVIDYQTASGGAILLYWLGSATMIIASFGAIVWYKCGEFDYFVSRLYVGQSRAYTDLNPWRLLMKAALPVFGFLIYSFSLFLFAYFAFGAFFQLTAEKAPADVEINYLFIGIGFAATLIGGFIYQVLLNLFRLDVISAVAETGSIE